MDLITQESARTAHKKQAYNNSKLLNNIDFEYMSVSKTIDSIAQVYMKG